MLRGRPNLRREPANAEGNWQADYDHVHKQSEDQVVKGVGPSGVKGGEWKNKQVHDLLHSGAEEQSAHDWVLLQERQLAAGCVVGRGSRAGNEVVQEDAKNVGGGATVECTPPEQAAGDNEGNVPSEKNAGLEKVQGSGNQAAGGDSA